LNGIERRPRTRRDGGSYDVWRIRWIDDAGRKRSATFDRERDARDFKAKLRILRRSGELASLDAGRESLSEFAARWWKLEAIPNFERATLKTYASHWNCHVLPRLGPIELRKLTPQVIVEFRAELEGAGVGREAIRRTLTMLQGTGPSSRVAANSNEPGQGRSQTKEPSRAGSCPAFSHTHRAPPTQSPG
jgi:integrase-like protein